MTNRVIATICDAVEEANAGHGGEDIWKKPLVSFIDAGDPALQSLKLSVSVNHLMPRDILPGAKSVVCYFIPFTERIITSNISGERASPEWARAYIETNALISRIGDTLETVLARSGFSVGKIPATHNFDPEVLISDWSHRHLAAIAGLGSFGLNNMLITGEGCCGRFGSMVTDCPLEAVKKTVGEKCLYKIDGSCGACVTRCVGGAYPEGGFDRFACYRACLENAEFHRDIGYADVCGKCLVGLPCSAKDPSARRRG